MNISKTVLFIFISVFLISCAHISSADGGQKLPANPKIAVYWTAPYMSQEDAVKLAKYHLIIADMENIINNPDSLRMIKRLSPNTKIIAYSNPMEFFYPMVDKRPLQKEQLNAVKEKYGNWWLTQPNGNPVLFFKGMRMLNLSDACQKFDGQRWNQYHAQFLLKRVFFDQIWDGYFMDNSGGNVSWIMNGNIDANRDGIKDDPKVLDRSWSNGIREFLWIIRKAKGDKFIMVGNKMTLEYIDLLNGKMSEEFPNNYLGDKKADGWYQTMENYFQAGPYSIIHARQIANDPEYRTFIIASALMGDGYYAYGHNMTRQFPEYEDIGKALGPAEKKADNWQRRFEKAVVTVWPEKKKGEIIKK